MKKLIIIFLLVFSGFWSWGQLVHNADTVIPVDYIQTSGSDSIFIVKGPGPNGFSDTLKLTAIFPNDTSGLIQFYKISQNEEEDTLEQELLLEKDSTNQLSYSTLEQGGYQIRFFNDSIDTTITRWAYFNNLIVNPFYQESCDQLFIQGIEGGISFYYFHPDTISKTVILDNGLNLEWKDYYQNPDSDIIDWIELDTLEFDPTSPDQNFSPPPIEYKTYLFKVEVNDSFGHYGKDSLVYEAIAVEADFEATVDEEVQDTVKEEAPLEVGFVNKSLNAELYNWTFYNDSARVSDGGSKVIRESNYYEPLDLVYYKYPGFYDVKLKAEGRVFIDNGEEKTCVDSVTKRVFVTVYKSFLGDLPNVITPGDGGKNEKFYFDDITEWDYSVDPPKDEYPTTSIEYFEVLIYNRYGLRVYHYEGSDWDGWDGKYNGKVVDTGVYFYVIRARGYEGKTFREKGFFHVYSNKE